jgi:hypothetical protein
MRAIADDNHEFRDAGLMRSFYNVFENWLSPELYQRFGNSGGHRSYSSAFTRGENDTLRNPIHLRSHDTFLPGKATESRLAWPSPDWIARRSGLFAGVKIDALKQWTDLSSLSR